MDTPALPTQPAPPEPAFAARVQSLKQLSALYDQALAMDGPARQAWLAALQAAGSPHAPALLRMLAGGTADNADRLPDMDAVAAWPSSSAAPAFAAGRNFGRWRLLRPLGTGGMAEVWLAERNEGTLHRQAAVKLLQCDLAGRKRDSFLHRFARERDILAALRHAHIAALYEAGIDAEGQPWLALEYVDGVPITRWCDEHAVPLRDRLRLFLQVLDAVAHAHTNLVMHRDLKPSNILVTPAGQVRLLDFGIAALVAHEGAEHEATELTRNAGAPMTPLYASPEQLRGQPLTTACDVYSLGVLLYELLCGQRPYALTTYSAAEIERAVLQDEPRPPSRRGLDAQTARSRGVPSVGRLSQLLAGDLDAVVLKALAKPLTQRYASVEALRNEIERWLADLPVLARLPGLAERALKFTRRHRAGVALGALSLGTVATLAVTALLFGLQARDEARNANATREFVLQLFDRADPTLNGGREATARDLIEAGDLLVSQHLGHDLKQQAQMLGIVGRLWWRLGDPQRELAVLQRRSQLLRAHGPSPALAESLLEVGYASALSEQWPRVTQALAESDRLGLPLSAVAHAWRELQSGLLAYSRGAADEATVRLRQAVAAADRSGQLELRLVARHDLAAVLGHSDAALALHREAAALLQADGKTAPLQQLRAQFELARTLYASGRYAEGWPLMQAVVDTADRVLGRHSPNQRALREYWLAWCLKMDQAAQALAWLQDQPALLAAAPAGADAAASWFSLVARVQAASGLHTEAQQTVERGLALLRPDDIAAGQRLAREQAALLLQRGQSTPAQAALDSRWWQGDQAAVATRSGRYREWLLGLIARQRLDHAGARQRLQQALALTRERSADSNPELARLQLDLAVEELWLAAQQGAGHAPPAALQWLHAACPTLAAAYGAEQRLPRGCRDLQQLLHGGGNWRGWVSAQPLTLNHFF